jgi:hypothetical protein
MRRREFISLLGGAAAAWPFAARTHDVAARSVQAGDKTSFDRITSGAKNDRNGPARSLDRHCRGRALWRHNYGHSTVNQIGGQFRQALIDIVRPAEFDRDIAAFDEAGFAQTSAEGGYKMCSRLRRTGVDISDHWHRRLLCACRERP